MEPRNTKRISRKEWKAAYRRVCFENARLVQNNAALRDRVREAEWIIRDQQLQLQSIRTEEATDIPTDQL